MTQIKKERDAVRVVVIVEGGIVQKVFSTEPVQVELIDLDLECADEEEAASIRARHAEVLDEVRRGIPTTKRGEGW